MLFSRIGYIKPSKTILHGLMAFYGLNRSTAISLCKLFFISPTASISEIPPTVISKLDFYLEEHFVLFEKLRQTQLARLKQLTDIKSLRGIRLQSGLPVRGQRTHSNASTACKFKLDIKAS